MDYGTKHKVHLHIPSQLNIETIADKNFNSWWGCFATIKCLNCEKYNKLSDIKKILSEDCDLAPPEPAVPEAHVIPNLGTITNKLRSFCGLPECKTATYNDSRRQAFIDRHNLQNYHQHNFILPILPAHDLHAHLRTSTMISHDIARTRIFRCTKCAATFTALSIRAGIKLFCHPSED